MKKTFILIVIFILTSAWENVFCENGNYESHGKRDPFVPLIGQEKAYSAGLTDITAIEDIRLEGIAQDAKGKRIAIINGEIVKEGFKSGEIEIVKIERKSVAITISGKAFKIDLPEEGGPKSER